MKILIISLIIIAVNLVITTLIIKFFADLVIKKMGENTYENTKNNK